MPCKTKYLYSKWIGKERVELKMEQFWAGDPQNISEILCEKIWIFINLLGMCDIDSWVFGDHCDEEANVFENVQIHQSDVQDFQDFQDFQGCQDCQDCQDCQNFQDF
jgi:hypothetical protein